MLDILWSGRNRPSSQGSPEPEATAAAAAQAAGEAGRGVGREATSGPPASPQEPADGHGPLAEGSSALPASQDSARQAAPAEEPSESAARALAEQALGYELAARHEEPSPLPRLTGRGRRGRRLVPKDAAPASPLTPQQRLLLLDTGGGAACRPRTSRPWWGCPSIHCMPGRRSSRSRATPVTSGPTQLGGAGAPGRPIPNLVQARGEQLPFGDKSIDIVTLQNAPIRPGTVTEIARVIKAGGDIRLVGPNTPEVLAAHQQIATAVGGKAYQIVIGEVVYTNIIVPKR